MGDRKIVRDSDIEKMVALRDCGATLREIAKTVGVSHTTVAIYVRDGSFEAMKERIAREHGMSTFYAHVKKLAREAGYSSPWARYNHDRDNS